MSGGELRDQDGLEYAPELGELVEAGWWCELEKITTADSAVVAETSERSPHRYRGPPTPRFGEESQSPTAARQAHRVDRATRKWTSEGEPTLFRNRVRGRRRPGRTNTFDDVSQRYIKADVRACALHDAELSKMRVWLRVEEVPQEPIGGSTHSPGVCFAGSRRPYHQGWSGYTVTALDVAQAVSEPIVEEATDG
jgi:hypothetical protein